MKRTLMPLWSFVVGAVMLSLTIATAQAGVPSCVKEKAEFKKLYLELQAKFLNYNGSDTVVDANGNMKLVPHDKNKAYEGKVFETAIFQEYQNSLKKVAKLYQSAKFGADKDDMAKSTPGLVDFLKAIDDNQNSEYIQKNNINNVIDELYKASNAKFSGDNKKFALTDNDKYLLKKLLTHAQDRICSVEAFEKTGKTRNFDANYMNQIRNAPLNRLIGVIKGAKIGADSDLVVNENTAITSAMAEHMNQLAAWMKKNKACVSSLGNPAFIQANIQTCNYGKLLDVLNQDNVDQLQAVLHFINSNERFLNHAEAKAETALDELKLEGFIDSTFANLGNKVNCSKIEANGRKKLFVRNLPYDSATNKFDKSKIQCKLNNKILSADICAGSIDLISDEFGRGLEVKQKGSIKGVVSFSIIDNPDCQDLALSTPVLDKTVDICKAEGEKQTPKKDLVPSADKKSCIEKMPDADGLKTPEICKEEGEFMIPSEDKKSCIQDPTIKTPDMCKAEGDAKNPKETLIVSPDKKSCIADTAGDKTAETCKKEGDAKNPPEILIVSPDKKSCIADTAGDKTAEMCKAEGDAKNPKETLIVSPDKKSCIVDPASLDKTVDSCKEEGGKQSPRKELIPSEDKKTCVEKPKVNTAEAECAKKNAEVSEQNDGRPSTQWQVKDNKCIDTKAKPSKPKEEKEEDTGRQLNFGPETTPPARFVPIQIPTRQMYILPGMP